MIVSFSGGAMNVDAMLRVLNEEQVDYLLIGGMNFIIQQTITWAEANLPPHLRRNRPRTRGSWPK